MESIQDQRSQILYLIFVVASYIIVFTCIIEVAYNPYYSVSRIQDSSFPQKNLQKFAKVNNSYTNNQPTDWHNNTCLIRDKENHVMGNSRADDLSFRERFSRWYEADASIMSSIGSQFVTNPTKYLIYRCDSGSMRICGGWTDRVKGILLTYIMANLTGRVFKIDILDPPCHLDQYLSPSMINWTLPVSFHKRITRDLKDVRTINKIDNLSFLHNLSKTNFTSLFEERPVRYIYFKSNLISSGQLKKSTVYAHQLSWMSGLDIGQITATLYKRVFKLSSNLQHEMKWFMDRTIPTARHKLVCAHVRIGRNPTISTDSRVFFDESKLHLVWKFLSSHSCTDFDKIFFMSDSEKVVQLAKLQPFGHRIVESGGPILHIEQSQKFSSSKRCAGQRRLIFDQHVLMQCDVLLISRSGVSVLSAFIRGSNKNLFCLMKGGKIVPCTVENIVEVYKLKH